MNLYYHSSVNNHEIGIEIDEVSELERIRRFILKLTSEVVPYISEKRATKTKYEPGELDSEWKEEAFTVISIGYKWVKVLTERGFENKIELSKLPKMEEGMKFTARVRAHWNHSRYGNWREYDEVIINPTYESEK